MNVAAALSRALALAIILSGIPLLASLFVGFVVSVFQAATQIQEQALSFVPKLLATIATLYFTGPWLFSLLTSYSIELFNTLHSR